MDDQALGKRIRDIMEEDEQSLLLRLWEWIWEEMQTW